MGYNDHMRSSEAQSTATFTQDQIEGDKYTRNEDPNGNYSNGQDYYWNYVDN